VTVTASGGTSPYSGTGTFTATVGTFTYNVTDANGCISTTSVTITEPSVLAANVSGTNPATCGGANGSADLTVSGGTSAYTFVWSNAATSEDLNGVTAGIYNCTITDANGCTTTASVTLNDPALPTVTYSNAFVTICLADAAQTLTGGSPSGGTYSGTGVSAGVFDPAAAGTGTHVITYTYTDGNSCTSSAIDTVTVDVCTGLNSVNASVSFTVMPNPNNGLFTLTLNSTEYADVYVYDATGKAIQSERMLANEKFDMTIETAGIYFITAVSADGTRTTQRVIVQK
jgi:large repetitive protein